MELGSLIKKLGAKVVKTVPAEGHGRQIFEVGGQ